MQPSAGTASRRVVGPHRSDSDVVPCSAWTWTAAPPRPVADGSVCDTTVGYQRRPIPRPPRMPVPRAAHNVHLAWYANRAAATERTEAAAAAAVAAGEDWAADDDRDDDDSGGAVFAICGARRGVSIVFYLRFFFFFIIILIILYYTLRRISLHYTIPPDRLICICARAVHPISPTTLFILLLSLFF